VAAIRPYRHSDAEALAALTLAAIRETALRAYSPARTEAWAARHSVQRLLDGAAKGDVPRETRFGGGSARGLERV
jgi:putative acetyltransferase